MRKVISHLILTLDGVAVFNAVADAIQELRDTEEVLADFFAKMAQEDALLGRITYQEWANYWPTSTDEPFSGHINRVPKYVFSRTLESAPWGTRSNTKVLKSTDAIARLKQEPGKNIGIHGSPR